MLHSVDQEPGGLVGGKIVLRLDLIRIGGSGTSRGCNVLIPKLTLLDDRFLSSIAQSRSFTTLFDTSIALTPKSPLRQ